MAKKTYVVTHPNLYLMQDVNKGRKLCRIPKGTEYECDELDEDSHLIKGRKLVLAVKPRKARQPKTTNDDS